MMQRTSRPYAQKLCADVGHNVYQGETFTVNKLSFCTQYFVHALIRYKSTFIVFYIKYICVFTENTLFI